jgi:hypothetical protein
MILQATVTQKPVSPGRARYKPLTPSRRECRCFGWTCGEYACVLSAIAHKAAGAAKHPAFPAPSSLEGDFWHHSGANSAAGMRRCVLGCLKMFIRRQPYPLVIPGRPKGEPGIHIPRRAWPLGHSRNIEATSALFCLRECGKPQARCGYGSGACALRASRNDEGENWRDALLRRTSTPRPRRNGCSQAPLPAEPFRLPPS